MAQNGILSAFLSLMTSDCYRYSTRVIYAASVQVIFLTTVA